MGSGLLQQHYQFRHQDRQQHLVTKIHISLQQHPDEPHLIATYRNHERKVALMSMFVTEFAIVASRVTTEYHLSSIFYNTYMAMHLQKLEPSASYVAMVQEAYET
jgi:hypothetical protein